MTSDYRKSAEMLAAAADLLDQGEIVNRLSRGLTVLAAAILLLPLLALMAPVFAILCALAGMAELALAGRVRLDAALFRRAAADAAADRFDMAAFDAALVTLRLMPAAKAGRPIETRFYGARRLLVLQIASLVVQVAIIGAAGLWQFAKFH
jgi:hypothetical protein